MHSRGLDGSWDFKPLTRLVERTFVLVHEHLLMSSGSGLEVTPKHLLGRQQSAGTVRVTAENEVAEGG